MTDDSGLLEAPTDTTDTVCVPIETDRLLALLELHGGTPEAAVADAVDVLRGFENPAEMIYMVRDGEDPGLPEYTGGETIVERLEEDTAD